MKVSHWLRYKIEKPSNLADFLRLIIVMITAYRVELTRIKTKTNDWTRAFQPAGKEKTYESREKRQYQEELSGDKR